MVIKSIAEIKNPNEVNFKPIKECMQIFVPDIINENISRRNGAVYVFSRQGVGGPWVQTQTITWSLQSSSSAFGTSVDLSGDANTLVVGSLSNSSNPAQGKAQVILEVLLLVYIQSLKL
jgi:hypothetical protein